MEDGLHRQLSEKRQQILDLEHQLATYRRDLATTRGQMAASEEVRRSGREWEDNDIIRVVMSHYALTTSLLALKTKLIIILMHFEPK